MNMVPAYGRDYKSAKAVKEDFDAGKDFQIADISSPYDGKYVNKAQLDKGSTHTIRYKKLTQVCVVKVQ